MTYEYAVVPAPKKGLKARGVKSTEDRFANALQTIMNEYGAKGWEYVRTDTLPSEERSGFTGRTTVYQNMMVFRKVVVAVPPKAAIATPDLAPAPAAPVAAPAPQPVMRMEGQPHETDLSRSEPKLTAD